MVDPRREVRYSRPDDQFLYSCGWLHLSHSINTLNTVKSLLNSWSYYRCGTHLGIPARPRFQPRSEGRQGAEKKIRPKGQWWNQWATRSPTQESEGNLTIKQLHRQWSAAAIMSHGGREWQIRPVPGSKREVPFYRADNFPGLPIDIFNNLACFFSIMHIMIILKSNIDLLFTVLLVYIFIFS